MSKKNKVDIEDNIGEEEPVKSRTQIKLEMEALQQLGVQLSELTPSQFALLNLDEKLKLAIEEVRTMRHREGRRRQLQYIGKLMRAADADDIRAQLAAQQTKDAAQNQMHHLAEQWRDRLIAEGDEAINAFASDYWEADRQHLRSLVRSAQKEQAANKPPASARKVFRYVRDLIVER